MLFVLKPVVRILTGSHNSLLLAAIPEIPLEAKIPVIYRDLLLKDYCVEIPTYHQEWQIMYGRGLPDYVIARRQRAQRRKDLNDPGWFFKFFRTAYDLRGTREVQRSVRAAEDIEVPRLNLLLRAPPGVSQVLIDPGELITSAVLYSMHY